MPVKECDPRCSGRCNKNKLNIVITADKACDPKCTGRCSKKNAGTSPPGKRGVIKRDREKSKEITPPEKKDETEKPTPPSADISSSLGKDIKDEAPKQEVKDIPSEKEKSIDDKSEEIKPQTTPQKQSISKSDENVNKNCVIIDLDGVILDIETVYQYVIGDLVKKYGIPNTETQKIVDLQDNETSTKFCRDYKLNISPQEFMIEFRKSALKELAQAPLMPGIENLTDYLLKNNYPVAVASNSNEAAYQLKTQNHRKFFQKFSHIVLAGSDPEVKSRKPSPKVYEVCGSRFSSKPNPKDILVLEDAPEGVSAALAAGMNVIWFPNKYANRDNVKGVTAILNSITEFNPKDFGLAEIN
ncbi:hypothetical protein WA026_008140 [Henosepilachna vigintioctopunctata]|uniref:Uncharacterized protein n=1 Tax=Henosepilachna vigintioctopunctata TaxID=420089 RepID=A0AAW1TKU1_9CUCU